MPLKGTLRRPEAGDQQAGWLGAGYVPDFPGFVSQDSLASKDWRHLCKFMLIIWAAAKLFSQVGI